MQILLPTLRARLVKMGVQWKLGEVMDRHPHFKKGADHLKHSRDLESKDVPAPQCRGRKGHSELVDGQALVS